jgi:hypothetical protein
MANANRDHDGEKDGLRLLALSRIPCCSACKRFQALKQAHEFGPRVVQSLAPVSPSCVYPYCRPLVARLAHDGGEPLRGSAATGTASATARPARGTRPE